MKNKLIPLVLTFVAFVVTGQAQTTNKTFVLNNGTGGTTDNYLPPNETNFFDENYVWLAGALARGGFSSGDGGGTLTLDFSTNNMQPGSLLTNQEAGLAVFQGGANIGGVLKTTNMSASSPYLTNAYVSGYQGTAMYIKGDIYQHDLLDVYSEFGTPVLLVDGLNMNVTVGGQYLTNTGNSWGVDQFGTITGTKLVATGAGFVGTAYTNSAQNAGTDAAGTTTAVQFVGRGAGITGLNASQLSSGTIPQSVQTVVTNNRDIVLTNQNASLAILQGGANIGGVLKTTNMSASAPYLTNAYVSGYQGTAMYIKGDIYQHDLLDVYSEFGTPVLLVDGLNMNVTVGGQYLTNTGNSWGADQFGTITGTKFVASPNGSAGFTGNGAGLTNIQSTNITGPYFTNIQVEADLLTTNLTQWVVKGNSVWSIASSNVLLATGNSGDSYGDYLVNTNFGDPFHWTTLKFNLRILQTNAVAEIGFGTFSEAAYVPSNLVFAISINPSSGNGTVLAWYGGTASPNEPKVVACSPTPVFGGYFATNQPWGITLTRRDEQYSINISNQITGAQWGWTFSYQTASTTAGFEPSGWGYPCLWSSGALTANFANWTMTADTFWPVKFLAFGDSKTSGYGNVDPETQWTRRLARAYGPGVCIDAAGNATSQDATNWVLAKIFRPQIAVLDIGVNDLALGLSAAQTEANITNFWGLNSNYCGKFYAVMPEPYNASSAAFDTFVSTNYAPTNVLDFDSPLATYGSWVLTNTLSMDGLHPNGAGNGMLFNIVNNKINNRVP